MYCKQIVVTNKFKKVEDVVKAILAKHEHFSWLWNSMLSLTCWSLLWSCWKDFVLSNS